jgi:hypothetical protein
MTRECHVRFCERLVLKYAGRLTWGKGEDE